MKKKATKRHIEYHPNFNSDGSVSVVITEQTHRGVDFTPIGKSFSFMHNGDRYELSSYSFPETYLPDINVVCVLGDDKKSDKKRLNFKREDFKIFECGVKKYNARYKTSKSWEIPVSPIADPVIKTRVFWVHKPYLMDGKTYTASTGEEKITRNLFDARWFETRQDAREYNVFDRSRNGIGGKIKKIEVTAKEL